MPQEPEERESRARTSKGVRYTDEELQLAAALLRYLRFNTLADLLHEASIIGMLILATRLPESADLPDFAGRGLPAQLPELAWQELMPAFDYLARRGVLPRSYSGGVPHVVAGPAGRAPAPSTGPTGAQEPGPLEVDREAGEFLDRMGSTLLD